MQLIDLSGEIFHKCPTLPNHPPVTIVDYQTHDTLREAEVSNERSTPQVTDGVMPSASNATPKSAPLGVTTKTRQRKLVATRKVREIEPSIRIDGLARG